MATRYPILVTFAIGFYCLNTFHWARQHHNISISSTLWSLYLAGVTILMTMAKGSRKHSGTPFFGYN